jgi:arylsulfatase B
MRFTHQLPPQYLKDHGLKGYYNYDPAVHDYMSWYIGSRQPHNPEGRALYLGQLNYLDKEIGRLLDFLENEGLRENTLIAYVSENGGSTPIYANNEPLRGSKYTLYEGGIRVPMMISWPEHTTRGTILENVVSVMDLYPTICAAAGIKDSDNIDGFNLLPLLNGSDFSIGHDILVWDTSYETAVRKGTWKFKTANTNTHAQRQQLDVRVGEFLYNLENDPGETRDLLYLFPDKVKELKAIYSCWRKEMDADQ